MTDPSRTSFERWANKTRTTVSAAEKAERAAKAKGVALRPAETAAGVLYVASYRFFLKLKRKKSWLALLAQHLSNDPSQRWSRHQGVGSAIVLRLLERQGEPWFITPSRRARIATELNFAAEHNVAPKLLLAFLYEAGSHRQIRRSMRARKKEPWIADYELMSKLLRNHKQESAATQP
jgi:hypothetical protein